MQNSFHTYSNMLIPQYIPSTIIIAFFVYVPFLPIVLISDTISVVFPVGRLVRVLLPVHFQYL